MGGAFLVAKKIKPCMQNYHYLKLAVIFVVAASALGGAVAFSMKNESFVRADPPRVQSSSTPSTAPEQDATVTAAPVRQAAPERAYMHPTAKESVQVQAAPRVDPYASERISLEGQILQLKVQCMQYSDCHSFLQMTPDQMEAYLSRPMTTGSMEGMQGVVQVVVEIQQLQAQLDELGSAQ